MSDESIRLDGYSPTADEVVAERTVPDGEIWYVDFIEVSGCDGAGSKTTYNHSVSRTNPVQTGASRVADVYPRGGRLGVDATSTGATGTNKANLGWYLFGGDTIGVRSNGGADAASFWLTVAIRRIV